MRCVYDISLFCLFITCGFMLYKVESSCDFSSVTGEILQNVCDWSHWLPWNCTCCGPNVPTQPWAVRQRGLCCETNADVLVCMADCGYSFADDRKPCNQACANKTTNSTCVPEDRVTVIPKSTTPTPPTTAPIVNSTSGTTPTPIAATAAATAAASTSSTNGNSTAPSISSTTPARTSMTPGSTSINRVTSTATTPPSYRGSNKLSGNGNKNNGLSEGEYTTVVVLSTLAGLMSLLTVCCVLLAVSKKKGAARDRVQPLNVKFSSNKA